MPQSFTWALASAPGAGGAGAGTNAAGPASTGYYAVARRLDAGAGDVVMAGATWARGQPAAEIVLRCLRTPRGRYLPDPTYGLDYAALQKGGPNAGARVDAAVRAALAPLVRRGVLKDRPEITVTVTGTSLLIDVAFVDPRAPAAPVRLTGQGTT